MLAEILAPLVNMGITKQLPDGYQLRGGAGDNVITTWARIIRSHNIPAGKVGTRMVKTLIEIFYHEDHILIVQKITPNSSRKYKLSFLDPAMTVEFTVDTVMQHFNHILDGYRWPDETHEAIQNVPSLSKMPSADVP